MIVRYTPRALSDLDQIHDHIAQHNPSAAKAVGVRIRRSIEALATFPGMGRETDRTGIRVLPVGRYPYLIFYTIDQDRADVAILHIRHGARRTFDEDGG